MKSASCVLIVLLCVAFCSALTPSFQVTEMTGFKVAATYNQSTLYDIELEDSPYESNQPIQLLDLHAPNAYSRGFAYAMLVGHQGVQNYNYLMASVFQTKAQQEVVEMFLQWQWDNYLSKEVPQQFLDELQGIADAGKAQNLLRLYKDVLYAIVLANFPGNVGENVYYLLMSEAKDNGFQGFNGMDSEQILDLMKNAFRRVPLMHCSMFGIWGSRTTNTSLFTMRNLDWLPNSGIAVNKLITVFHPVGGHAYATIGFSGLIGALTGMSSKGLTVHEAANDSNQETFLGFAWTLRLRELMEKSANLKEATDFWKRTNNTLGMNHGVGSGSDKNFVALETFAGYTAFFGADDPREADYFVTEPNGTKIQMGFPIPEAVWRTNHGYDPTVISHETYPPTSYSSNSEKRYLLIHDSITWYQSESILIDHPQAINITSVVADKGSDFYSCANTAGATNVLSVTYLPESLDMWVAFEVGGTGTSKPHLPACCGTYAHINLRQWLTPFA